MDKKEPQPAPVNPKPTPTQTAQESPQQTQAIDPKATASPRVLKYNEDSQPVRYIRGQ